VCSSTKSESSSVGASNEVLGKYVGGTRVLWPPPAIDAALNESGGAAGQPWAYSGARGSNASTLFRVWASSV
jgi:hypothetical protein